MILFLDRDRLFPVGNLCFQFKGNYFDREFVLAFWTCVCELLLRILFLDRDKLFSCGYLCFQFKGNYFERGFCVSVYECWGGEMIIRNQRERVCWR